MITCRLDQVRRRLAASALAFTATARSPRILRAQLSFGAAWTAEWAFTVAIAVVAFDEGGAAAVGLVAFLRLAPSAFLAPVGTALGDRFARDRVLVWACVIRAVATAAAAAVLAMGGSTIAVYVLAIVATAAFTTFRPVHSALLPSLCATPLELTSANVVRGLLDSISTLVGPLLAALLLEIEGPASVFACTALLSILSGALLLRLPYESSPRRNAEPIGPIVGETIDGFRALARYREAALLISLGLVQILTRGFFNVFAVLLAIDVLGLGAPGVGLLTAAVGAGAVVGSIGVSAFVSGRRLAVLLGIGVVLWGLPLTLSGAFPDPLLVLGLMGLIGIGNALVDVGLFTLIPRLVPEILLARIFGALESLGALFLALGSLVTPVAIAVLGIQGAMIALGLLGPAFVTLVWRRLRAIDASIGHRDREIAVLARVAIFRPLPMPAIDTLATNVEHVDFLAGDVVFRQGDHGDRFYVIDAGDVEVVGDGQLIRMLGAGEGFGEIALLRDTPRTTTVRARARLHLFALDRRHFLRAVGDYQSSAAEAETMVAERLHRFDPGTGRGA